MAEQGSEDVHDRVTPFLATVARVTSAVGSLLANGTAQLIDAQRGEVRKLAAVLALALAAAIFGCAAAGFAAYAILLALGEEHRVAGSALIAGCFALLSGIAALLARGRRSG
jgi:MFS family permease